MAENHTKVYGFCENYCKVEVSPKDEVVHTNGDEVITGTKYIDGLLAKNQTSRDNSIRLIQPINDLAVIPSQIQYSGFRIYDKNMVLSALLRYMRSITYQQNVNQVNAIINNSTVEATSNLVLRNDGTKYLTAPSTPSNAVNEEVITANALNSWSSVVHTVGNEEIAGSKTFKTNSSLESGTDSVFYIRNTNQINAGAWKRYGRIVFQGYQGEAIRPASELISTQDARVNVMSMQCYKTDEQGTQVAVSRVQACIGSDNVPYGAAPTTPTNARANEIATAGWVRNTINSTVPVTKQTMTIENITHLQQALDKMKNGALGNICLDLYVRLGDSQMIRGVTVTGLIDSFAIGSSYNAHGELAYGLHAGRLSVESAVSPARIRLIYIDPTTGLESMEIGGADCAISGGKYVYIE